jgi:hypothetical protein
MRNREREIFENRAALANVAVNECENCGSPLIFALRCGEAEFSLGLEDVLRCLRIAEEEACVPKLPEKWWSLVRGRHDIR